MADSQVMDPEAAAPETDHQPTDNPPTDDTSSKAPDASLTQTKPESDLPRWHYSLPDPLKGHEALKGFSTMGEAAKAFVELKGKAERLVEIPGADATMEEREAFYEKIGRPKTPAEYELKKPENWPPDQPWSANAAKAFAEKAFRNGLPKHTAEALHADIVAEGRNALLDHSAKQKAEAEKREEILKETFGAHVEERVKLAHRSMEMVGGPAVKAELEAKGLLRSPSQIKAWLRIWETVGEDKIFSGAADPGGKTQEERVKKLYPTTQW